MIVSFKKRLMLAALVGGAGLFASQANAQCLTNNATGTHDGYYFS